MVFSLARLSISTSISVSISTWYLVVVAIHHHQIHLLYSPPVPINCASYIVKRPWLAPPFSRSSQWLRLLEMASSAPNSSSAPSYRLFQAFFTPSASYAPNPTSAFGHTSNSIHFSYNSPPGDSFLCFFANLQATE